MEKYTLNFLNIHPHYLLQMILLFCYYKYNNSINYKHLIQHLNNMFT